MEPLGQFGGIVMQDDRVLGDVAREQDASLTRVLWLASPVIVRKLIRLLSKHTILHIIPENFERLVEQDEIPFAQAFFSTFFPNDALKLLCESFAPEPEIVTEGFACRSLVTLCQQLDLHGTALDHWIDFLKLDDDHFDAFFQANPMAYTSYSRFCRLRYDSKSRVPPTYEQLADWSEILLTRQRNLLQRMKESTEDTMSEDMTLAQADLAADVDWFIELYAEHGKGNNTVDSRLRLLGSERQLQHALDLPVSTETVS
eukprot:TRINITY_DN14521_c0_g1_i1.p1 TRINITY_DN14521_c0_g1~~TRINITY_DN14521_c0_g1_i1.p1  ORF type:complete len:258 (-),score=22.90 TRINITY_DN14521_c0_g1_i1:153-926(-)